MNQYDMAEAGFRVFGLNTVNKDGSCGCGNPECPNAGKHPIASSWQYTPEWSEEQWEVIEMTGQMETGYGVLVKGHLIIDVDQKNGGVESFSRLCQDTGLDLLAMAGLAIATGSGRGSMHLYYKAPEGVALRQSHPDYKGIDFKTTGFVVGPGSLHKSGNMYEVMHGDPEKLTLINDAVVQLLKKPEHFRSEYQGHSLDVSEKDLRDMLGVIDADCDHETWVRCGMALHHATGGTGFELWDDWSRTGAKYPGSDVLEKRWHSFGKSANPVKAGTLIHFAQERGYHLPVTFEMAEEMERPVEGLPFSLDGVDLLRPPGFVGEVCQWINSQCMFPRQHLAVAASLVAMGNVCGLRYTDDKDNVSLNMFAFCVAGSGTGKEAVQQAIFGIHKAAGVHRAAHGSIKSEQEIVKNLIRHQAALYVIDEVGILLKKIANAQKRGGAAYLDGVIGMLMSAFGKANGYMPVSGDVRDMVKQELCKELALCRKKVDENEDQSGAYGRRAPQLERAIDELDNGLEKPFLSMVGFTTPITFDGLMDNEQATNGFLGRSLLVKEIETNPRAKRGFKKRAMSSQMTMTLSGLYSGGYFDPESTRVEYYGEKSIIPSTDEAIQMMDKALDWLEEYAEHQKETTGLEAIPKRGYEMLAKISTILAVPEGLRTGEHVRWAFAMVRRDIETKIKLAFSNDREKDSPEQALMAHIMGLISGDHGETTGVIVNRCRKYRPEMVHKTLDHLEKNAMIRKEITKHGGNGKEVLKWFTVELSSVHAANQSLH